MYTDFKYQLKQSHYADFLRILDSLSLSLSLSLSGLSLPFLDYIDLLKMYCDKAK
mgnify:CR=1 FL=1